MSFEEDYDQAIDDLCYEIARYDLGIETDNYRAYCFDTGEGFEEYVRRAKSGCCGIFESHTKINGKKWIIGCNYGH